MNRRKKTIIFIAPGLNSFIASDIKILEDEFNVVKQIYSWKKKQTVPFLFVRQLSFLLKHIAKSHSIIVEFAGYWSYLPTILGKFFKTKTYIILHGTETASIPELNYGSLRKPLLKWFCKQSFRNAFMLLPVSKSLIKTKNTFYTTKNAEKQGVKHFFPTIKTPYKVIPNGLDIEFWKPNDEIKNPKSCIAVFGKGQFNLKGGDLLLELAVRMPDLNIYVAGYEYQLHNQPDNITFLGHINHNELRSLYSRSAYYFQLSAFEGFGLSLCEAMLCKCIPIGANVNAIPEIIGDSGYILKKHDPDALVKLVCYAIENTNIYESGCQARKRIIEQYPLSKRKNALIKTIHN